MIRDKLKLDSENWGESDIFFILLCVEKCVVVPNSENKNMSRHNGASFVIYNLKITFKHMIFYIKVIYITMCDFLYND